MYSDLLSIDANGVVQLWTYVNATLAIGCYDAIVKIMRMYRDSNAGPECACAVVYGVHKINTLVAHSDEGGFVSQVFRAAKYAPPHGAVSLDEDENLCKGMPRPCGSISSFRHLVHSILLGSGAAVIMADPMVMVEGKAYPSFITAGTGGIPNDPGPDEGGGGVVVPDAVRDSMQRKWVGAAAMWATNYTYLIGRLFSAGGKTYQAVHQLCAKAERCVGIEDDHLRRYCAVAFFLVEPTSIWSIGGIKLRSTINMCGPLAYEGCATSYPVGNYARKARLCKDMG